MKIALVCPYDFAYVGGVINHISSLARHFIRMGHEVKIIAPSSKPITAFGDRFIRLGTPLPIPANDSIVRITLSINLSSKVKELLDQEGFDIVHLHEPLMPTLCTTFLRFSDAVNIGTFHASYQKVSYVPGRPLDGYNFGKPFSTAFLKRRANRLDGRIAVSKAAMEFATRYFPGDYEVIPNGVDLELFSPGVSPLAEFSDGKTNILFVGRLEKRKGLHYLLDAYQRVKQEVRNSRLIIVGPGTRLRSKYEKQVIKEGIEDVVFIGQVPYEELPRFYKTADICCAPSTRCESFGLVLLEAMAVGKPVIASDVEGYANVVSHGVDGLLVTPKDEGALYGALVHLMRDKSLQQRMGEKGRAKVQDYGWSRVAQRVADYYLARLTERLSGKRQEAASFFRIS